MRKITKLNKKGEIDFRIIAKYPSSIFALGGIFLILLGKDDWGFTLMVLAAGLHIMWLKKGQNN